MLALNILFVGSVCILILTVFSQRIRIKQLNEYCANANDHVNALRELLVGRAQTGHIDAMQAWVWAWAQRKGWNERTVEIPEAIALMHTELSEATEAWRNKEVISWSDEKGKPQGIASEYADVVIRIMHDCGRRGIDLQKELIRKMQYNESREHRHGGKQG
jgi:NTP pyrophosphatase (non-canonical NTP hydrolase)